LGLPKEGRSREEEKIFRHTILEELDVKTSISKQGFEVQNTKRRYSATNMSQK
jgi:hypothetical protein